MLDQDLYNENKENMLDQAAWRALAVVSTMAVVGAGLSSPMTPVTGLIWGASTYAFNQFAIGYKMANGTLNQTYEKIQTGAYMTMTCLGIVGAVSQSVDAMFAASVITAGLVTQKFINGVRKTLKEHRVN